MDYYSSKCADRKLRKSENKTGCAIKTIAADISEYLIYKPLMDPRKRFFYFMEENKITRLAVQRKNPKRVNVYLDGSFAFGLYRDTAAWLEVGQTLSDEKIKKLLDEDQKADVYVKATDFISYRPRTVFETRKKLEDEGFDETLISGTINALTENGLLDDKRFAEQWVEERKALKPSSRRALQYELRRKGIPDYLIQSATEAVDDFQAAYEIAEKHLYRYEGLSKFDFRKKLGNYLAGKGFSYDVISDVTRELWKNINASSQ